ncbi:inactive serine/threonine-protein kinase VRK3 isoform X1 [Lates calcarifer]|uniref:Inactive serine/threonine-protein kinase VRK3 isoform X1 n=3 Tax=Lates calcarifer TaxID=8187 RepID=A0AAJ7PGF0_LATCA|nr:inactive serine/threonine-protein kinase VRK3 isoform X1 [Lates calcarifer]
MLTSATRGTLILMYLTTQQLWISIIFTITEYKRLMQCITRMWMWPTRLEKLKKLLEAGHSPSSALDVLKYDLQVQCKDDCTSADHSVCPDLHFCHRMPFHFCPQCGTKLQPGFRFCPSCGEKLPSVADESGPVSSTVSPPRRDEVPVLTKISLASSSSPSSEPRESNAHACTTSTPVTARPALRKTRNSLRLDREIKFNIKDVTPPVVPSTNDKTEDNGVGVHISPPKQHSVTFKLDAEVQPRLETSSSPVIKSPRTVRGKAKLFSPVVKQVEEGKKLTDKTSGKAEGLTVDGFTVAVSPVSSPISRSPLKVTGKSKSKKAKHAPTVEPLQEGEEVTDTAGKKWKLMKLLSQSTTEIIYEVLQTNSRSSSKEANHVLRLGAKDGRIFNEQNFLQRAAKPASVDKWIRQNKMDFLGIPSCVGFGPHADSYRFLIFPNMGQSLQSVIEEEDGFLSEKAVLHLACRLLDVLQYIHSNEYVHADINAENIYIKPGQTSQVYLVGYCHAFRYCPGGQHVEYREASRTPHEGTMEFISLDVHKGAAPSRRSDLQSLGYCMLRWHTGTLPWTTLTQPDQVVAQKQRYMEDVPALLSHCFGKTRVSSAFQTYLTAVMALQYSEQPDYTALKAGLSAALLQMGGSLEQPLSF